MTKLRTRVLGSLPFLIALGTGCARERAHSDFDPDAVGSRGEHSPPAPFFYVDGLLRTFGHKTVLTHGVANDFPTRQLHLTDVPISCDDVGRIDAPRLGSHDRLLLDELTGRWSARWDTCQESPDGSTVCEPVKTFEVWLPLEPVTSGGVEYWVVQPTIDEGSDWSLALALSIEHCL